MGETAHARGGLHDERTRLLRFSANGKEPSDERGARLIQFSGGSMLYDCEDGSYVVHNSS